jgi:hypothetical protein
MLLHVYATIGHGSFSTSIRHTDASHVDATDTCM